MAIRADPFALRNDVPDINKLPVSRGAQAGRAGGCPRQKALIGIDVALAGRLSPPPRRRRRREGEGGCAPLDRAPTSCANNAKEKAPRGAFGLVLAEGLSSKLEFSLSEDAVAHVAQAFG